MLTLCVPSLTCIDRLARHAPFSIYRSGGPRDLCVYFLFTTDNSSSQLNVNEMQAEAQTYQNISQPEKQIFRIRLFSCTKQCYMTFIVRKVFE